MQVYPVKLAKTIKNISPSSNQIIFKLAFVSAEKKNKILFAKI